ncbi:SCO1/SenC-domain-containing protein, partial [Russula vinacea]
MNSVLRSLRSSVLRRQLQTSKASHHVPPLHICGRTGWKQYSTHNPDGFKNKSAVGPVLASTLPPIGKATAQEQKRQSVASLLVGYVLETWSREEMESRSVGRPTQRPAWEMEFIYFGFTNCPDICPEELDKMSAAVTELDRRMVPSFSHIISVDPARDTPPKGPYVRDSTLALSDWQAIRATKATCKAYRVYSRRHPVQPGDDYSSTTIFFYFMDPEGKFVDAFG